MEVYSEDIVWDPNAGVGHRVLISCNLAGYRPEPLYSLLFDGGWDDFNVDIDANVSLMLRFYLFWHFFECERNSRCEFLPQ